MRCQRQGPPRSFRGLPETSEAAVHAASLQRALQGGHRPHNIQRRIHVCLVLASTFWGDGAANVTVHRADRAKHTLHHIIPVGLHSTQQNGGASRNLNQHVP